MTAQDLQQLEEAARLIITTIERNRVHEENAAERRAAFRLITPKKEDEEESRYRSKPLKFTKKEMESMPIQYKNLFFSESAVAHIRLRKDNLYEIRCQIDGKKITASSKTLETAKKKFLYKLSEHYGKTVEERGKTTFAEYAEEWLDTIKRPTVKATTMEDYLSTFRAHLLPHFGPKALASITRADVQTYLNGLIYAGKNLMQRVDSFEKTLTLGGIGGRRRRGRQRMRWASPTGWT